jgi:hypothetical protein
MEECTKIKKEHIKIIGNEENIDQFYAKVVYDGKATPFIEKGGSFYLDKKDNLGGSIQIVCNDPKLADKEISEISGSSSNGTTTMTKHQAIDELKKQDYVEPITLNPDSDEQTKYDYTDADGDSGTVTLVDGKIIVT